MAKYAKTLWGFVLVIVLGGLLAGTAQAQTFTATLSGRVVDPTGAVIAGATTTLRNVATNWEREAPTGADGGFTFTLLPPGEYVLTVEAEGFKKEVRSGITLQVGQQVALDVALAVGSRAEVVEVTENVPLMQTENAALGGVVEERKIVELPLNLRTYLSLAQLQPNVFLPAQGSTLGFRGGFNVAGNAEIANNFLLDGIDNLDEITNQPNHTPVLDAIREFRVLTGTYSAEYGRQSGGQVIVSTKSGTNEWHGSLYEFHRNDNLDARNFFVLSQSEFKRNQFGGTVGGPLRRDKTFFFASYEGLREGTQRASVASIPTVKMHQGNFSELLAGSGLCGGAGQPVCVNIRNPRTGANYPGNLIPQSDWHPAGKAILDLYPTTGLVPGLLVRNLPVGAVSDARVDQFSGRVDYRLGANTTLFGSYNFSDRTELTPILNPLCGSRVIPGYGCDELQRTQHLALVLTHTFSPRLYLEGRVGYNRFGFFRLQEDREQDIIRRLGITGLPDAGRTPFNDGAPTTTLTGFSTIGVTTNLPQGRHDNTYHYVGNLTYVRGKHTFKGGADIRRVLFSSFFTSFGRGQFQFTTRYTRHAVADLLLGLPSISDRNPGEPFHNAASFSSGFYFQDDWKVNPNFTFNWGIRYELTPPNVERVNKFSSFDPKTNTLKVAGGREALPVIDTSVPGIFLQLRPRSDVGRRMWNTDKNNWAPRVGWAWKPWGSQRWVIRGGYGIYYNLQILGNGITPLNRGLPFRLRQNFANTSTFSASTFTLSNAFPPTPTGTLAPAGIDPDFRTAYTQQWSLSVQYDLFKDWVVESSYLGSKGSKLPALVNWNQAFAPRQPRPFVPWSDILARVSGAASSYHGWQLRVEKRFSEGLSILSSYNWSRSTDDAPGISTGSDASLGTPQNSHNLGDEKGRSDFDISHRYVLSAIYELPVGRGRRFLRDASGVADTLLGGWQLTGIMTLQSGAPFAVWITTSSDVSRTFGRADRPNLVGDPFAPGPACPRPRTPNCWFNPAAFAAPRDGFFGTIGRNSLVGPTLQNFDFGLFKNFRIQERHRIQFRVEFFNLLNHPNFSLPDNVVSSFDATTRANTDASLGTIGSSASGNNAGAQRQIQFGLKWNF